MTKRSEWKIRALLRTLTGVGVASFAATLAQAQEAPKDTAEKPDSTKESTEGVIKLEKFEVTGSRIKRIDTETVSPVTTITASQFEVQGFNTLGEALQSLPQNTGQVLSPTDSGTSFTPGISTINLRGLGNNNTLVLVNGRRAVPYAAPGFNGFQTMFDFNSIPAAAIEKVEMIKDGASAIYGSDAVAGAVNILLRKDYEGLSTSVTIGNYLKTDGLIKKGSLLLGTHSAKTSMTAAFDYVEQNPTFARDFSYTKDADKGTDGSALQANPHYVATGWDQVTSDTYASEADYIAATVGADILDPSWGWFDNRSSMGYPGYVSVPGLGNRTFSTPTSTPTTAGAVRGLNYYNFQETNGLDPYYRRLSFYSTARHDFNDRFYAFAEFAFTRNEAEVYSAASPVNLAGEQGLTLGSTMYIPSYNTYNPWGVDLRSGRRRIVESGNRIGDITSDTPRLLLGLGGTLPDVGTLSDWSWETAMLYTKNTVNDISRNAITDYKMQQALMGLTRLGDGKLTWDPSTPTANRVYFNWFGLNGTDFADFLQVENPNSSTMEYTQFDAKTSGSLFQLPAGNLGLSVGMEHRQEKMEKVQTDLNATSNIVGGSAGTGFAGSRKVTSVFTELAIPLVKGVTGIQSLEAQIAARYEDYSDKGFASKARPKFALKYKPVDWLIFRGSFSQCFKAPDLAYLYTSSQTSFTSGSVFDPVTKTSLTQLQINTAGNTELQPELTDVSFFGVAFEPKGKLKGLQISLNGFIYKQKNLLTQLSDLYTYSDFLSEAYAGNPLFAGKVVRDASTNEVLYIKDDYANISVGEYKGVDIDVNYTLKTKTLGTFNFGTQATYIHNVNFGGDNVVGSYLTPKWRATADVGWRKGDWGTNLLALYYGKRVKEYSVGSWYDEGDQIYIRYTMDPRVVLNANISYYGIHNTTISLSVSNLLDTKPAMDPMDQNGATTGAGWFAPAFVSMRIDRKF